MHGRKSPTACQAFMLFKHKAQSDVIDLEHSQLRCHELCNYTME